LVKDMIIQGIPADLKKDFKTACSYFDLSMKKTLINHMQNIVNDYRKARFMIDSRTTFIHKKGD